MWLRRSDRAGHETGCGESGTGGQAGWDARVIGLERSGARSKPRAGRANSAVCTSPGGYDEIAWARGHTYFTLVYDIGSKTKRLLAIECNRTEKSLRLALESLGEPVCEQVRYVCSDMWKPHLNVIT